jgi:hypothetical protein
MIKALLSTTSLIYIFLEEVRREHRKRDVALLHLVRLKLGKEPKHVKGWERGSKYRNIRASLFAQHSPLVRFPWERRLGSSTLVKELGSGRTSAGPLVSSHSVRHSVSHHHVQWHML